MASNFHDKLLIDPITVQLCGCCGPQGMIGIVAWKACLLAHLTDCIPQCIDASWSVHVPSLPKPLFMGLQVADTAGSGLWEQHEILNNGPKRATFSILRGIQIYSFCVYLAMLETPLVGLQSYVLSVSIAGQF